jgi:hypothetical protein
MTLGGASRARTGRGAKRSAEKDRKASTAAGKLLRQMENTSSIALVGKSVCDPKILFSIFSQSGKRKPTAETQSHSETSFFFSASSASSEVKSSSILK